MFHRLLPASCFLLALFALAHEAPAQLCPPGSSLAGVAPPLGPDGLWDPTLFACCDIATPTLPTALPCFEGQCTLAMFDGCSLANQLNLNYLIIPIPDTTGERLASVVFQGTAPLPGGGSITMTINDGEGKYVQAYNPNDGTQLFDTDQVFRYVINGEMDYTTQVPIPPSPFPIPTTHVLSVSGMFNTIRFAGHLDIWYRPNPGNEQEGTWDHAFSLSHHVPCISNVNFPLINAHALPAAHPALFDPTTSTVGHNLHYHVVGPAPFIFGAPSFTVPPADLAYPVPVPASDVTLRSTRAATGPSSSYAVLEENFIANIEIVDVMQDCHCAPLSPSPMFWHETITNDPNKNLVYCDPSTLIGRFHTSPVPISPGWSQSPFPTGFLHVTVGHWPNSSALPTWLRGVHLTADAGVIDFFDACAAAAGVVGLSSGQIIHGVTTFATAPNFPVRMIDGLGAGTEVRRIQSLVNSIAPLGSIGELPSVSNQAAPYTGICTESTLAWSICR